MKIQIQSTNEELKEKSIPFIKSIADYVGKVNPGLCDQLVKAIEDKDKLFTDPVLLEVLKQWELAYKSQTDLMLQDIGKVLNKGKLNKSMDGGWIGVDFDGTLAKYDHYRGPTNLGNPIPKMVDRVRNWINEGKNVKIMTARANPNSTDARGSIKAIKKWCKQYIGKELDVVYEKDLHMEELWDDRAIQIKPNTGLRVDGLNKGEDEGISYFHYDVSIGEYIEDYDEDLNKAQKGPFIGPRGGKWADPEHTIPWKEEIHSYSETKERYSDEEAERILDKIGERLHEHQAINPREKDDTGFSYIDMERWNSVSGVNSKRQLLQKYKRQIVNAYGLDEYHKLGLADTREGKGFKADIKPYYNKTWGSLMLPIDRMDRETFNKFREINKRHNVWFSNGENFIKEQYLDDFDFETYKKDMGEIGINVHPIKGERKQKVEQKDEKDLTPDEALQRIKSKNIKDAIVFKKTGPNTFNFWSTFSKPFNKLFKNKTPIIDEKDKEPDDYLYNVLSSIFEYKADKGHSRETRDLDAAEEALEAIQKYLPEYKLYIDEKGLKEAQDERARYEAELQKPIPGVQAKLDPKYSLFPYQNEGVRFLDKTNGNALIGDEMGLGKAGWINEHIATPNGWITFGEIKIGDYVIGSNGKPTQVLGVYPQGKKELYEIVFSDKSTFICSADHLWTVQTANDRFRNKSKVRVLSLKELNENGLHYENGNSKWFIPIVEPVEYSTKKLCIHPYLLGALIANGSFTNGSIIHSGDEEQRIEMLPYIPSPLFFNRKSDYEYAICGEIHNSVNSLVRFLKDLGLYGKVSNSKYIPKEYLFSSIDQRLALLQGLVDNDGTVSNDGYTVEYNTVSFQLAKDIIELVQSLGGIALYSNRFPTYVYKGEKKIGQKDHRIRIKLPSQFCPVRINRKKELFIPNSKYPPTRSIAEINYVGFDECLCIKVKANDELFCVSNYILTHNTLETLAWVAKGDHRTILVVPKVVRKTWLEEAEKFFPGHFKGAELISSDLRNNRILDLKDKNIVTVNYESLDKFYPYLKEAGFDTVVVDESHRMKNPKAKQTKAIQKVGQVPSIKHHILLSGTAIKNKKEELFTQLQLVVPGKFQSKNQIKFATIGGLWHQMKEFYIARTKKKVLKDLPEKVTSIIQQEIPGLPDYDASKDIGDVARLKAKIAIGKVPVTIDLAKEILDSSDSKIIVFTDSVEAANKIYDELGHDVALLHHGQMSDGKREEVKSEFQRTNEQGDFISTKRVFVTTRQSMAVGATLTAADKVIFNDLPWSAADVTQAEDRAHRIGQKNNVNVYWVTAENNQFDSSVSDLVKTKYELSKKMNQGKKLSADEVNWMNKPVTVSDILNKIHGGKTPIEAVKELPIKETKVDEPVIPVDVSKQEEQRPTFSIKGPVQNIIIGDIKELKKDIEDTQNKINKLRDNQLKDYQSGSMTRKRITTYNAKIGQHNDRLQELKSILSKKESEFEKQNLINVKEEQRPTFSIKETVGAPKVTTVQSVLPDSQLDPREIIQRIKSYGKDRKQSYELYEKIRGDKKELNEKDFNFVMDQVDSNAFDKPREIKFKPTHTDINNVVEVMVTERTPGVVHYIDSIGRYKSIGAFDFDRMFNTVKEEPKLVIQEPVKKKRGRPPGSKNIKRTPMVETAPIVRTPMTIQEPVTPKKRGRPPGSKNIKRTPMTEPSPIVRTPIKEENAKRGRPPKSESVKASESSLSYVSAKGIKLKKVDSDEVHDIYQTNLAIDSDDAKIAMKDLRDKGINVTILEGDPGIIKIRKGFNLSEQDLLKALFLGPQGGRWSDAAHTIPYKETSERTIKKEPPGSQLPLSIQNKLKELKVDKLPQASIPASEIKTDFSGDINSKAIITWKDTKGKIQSGYTPKFHEMNAKKKWDRIMRFRDKKDGVVRSLNGKLQNEEKGSIDHQGYTILAIITETGLRPGSIASVQKHGHYGISTLKKEHIAINDKMAVLNFIGKEGKKNVTVVKNPVTLKALQYYIDNPIEGDSLFNPNSLDKVKDILPKGMKVKDLRTIKATESAERFFKQVDTPPPLTGDTKKDKRLLAKALLETSKKVATILNNTPSIAKASYIHPMVFEQWARNVGAKDSLWKEVG